MFNDTIEYDYRRTGRRREGSFTGLFSLIEKSFAALGIAALGGFLGFMGYVSSRGEGGMIDQPDSAVLAIAIGFAVVPFCTALISITAISFYDLTRERLKSAGAEP